MTLENPKRLDFSFNWNNKLDCSCFTTIRRHNPEKYKPDVVFEIFLKEQMKGRGYVVRVKTFRLELLDDFEAFLDTGYSSEETLGIIHKMYPDATLETLFDLVLIKRLKEWKP